MPEILPEKIIVAYETMPGRDFIPVTGAHGGVTSDGNAVVAHIYAEYGTLPTRNEAPVQPDGTVDLSGRGEKPSSDLTRQILATLVLSPESAILVGNWLVKKGENAQVARAASQAKQLARKAKEEEGK